MPDPPDRPRAQLLLDAALRADASAGARALADLGFRESPKSWSLLDLLLSQTAAELRLSLLAGMIAPLARSPDADAALLNFIRYGESRFGPEQLGALAGLSPPALGMLLDLFGYSQFFADVLIRYPHYLDWLVVDTDLARARDIEAYRERYQRAVVPFQQLPARRNAAIRLLRRELLRLGLRRIAGLSDEMGMMAELSDLAAATLQLALDEVTPPLVERFGRPLAEIEDDPRVSLATRIPPAEAGFCVIAMGKLGGRELNFSSDVDLIFIYSEEGRTTGRPDGSARVSNHLFFIRLAEALVNYVSEASEEGYFYRVDTRLRPDGVSGSLARSLTACEIYYTAQAHGWERMALLRARRVAGDPRLGRQFESMIRPLVLDPLHEKRIIEQVYDLKQRIDGDVQRQDDSRPDIKRGVGGIREIEFLVQAQQMIHGPQHAQTALWAATTPEIVRWLENIGRLTPDAAAQMTDDYLFLRTVEHRLQMMQLRQTHQLPDHPRALNTLALRSGLSADSALGLAPGGALMRRWAQTAERVHADFEAFFNPRTSPTSRRQGNPDAQDRRPDRETPESADAAGVSTPPAPAEINATALVLSAAPEMEVLPALAPFGLASAGALKSLRRLAGLGSAVYLTSDARLHFERLLPLILRAAAVNPRPDAAVANLESFLNAAGALAGYYEIFHANPRLFEILMLGFGSGDMIAHTLVAHPEFLDFLLDPARLQGPPERDLMRALLERWTADRDSDAAFCPPLARFRRLNYLLTGLGDLAGLIDEPTACARTCATAELILDRALNGDSHLFPASPPITHAPHPPDKRPLSPFSGFAVLAMGKLGTAEMNYQSDLDLIFVHDDQTFSPLRAGSGDRAQLAADLASRVVTLLTFPSNEGRAFEVDVRLRPEGSGSPLAPPVERYLEYYRDRAQVWEFQSAMKLRPVAGDLSLGRRLIAAIASIIADRLKNIDLPAELRAMRRRMIDNLKLPSWVFCDFKTGPGGSVDLEFIAQSLQMRHLAQDPDLIGLGPAAVFSRLAADGRLDPDRAELLSRNLEWLRRLERRARLLFDSDRSQLPAAGDKLIALERACAHLLAGSRHSLLDSVARLMQRNRKLFDDLIA